MFVSETGEVSAYYYGYLQDMYGPDGVSKSFSYISPFIFSYNINSCCFIYSTHLSSSTDFEYSESNPSDIGSSISLTALTTTIATLSQTLIAIVPTLFDIYTDWCHLGRFINAPSLENKVFNISVETSLNYYTLP